jgi:23S rRNA (guanosine2251-2'-O)-methyltransferase
MSDRRVVPGLHPVRELLRARTPIDHVHVASSRRRSPVLDEVVSLARAAGVEVRTASPEELDRITGGVSHQGVVAVAPPYRYRDLGELLGGGGGAEPVLLVALDGVTDPHNLGSVARTAEAVGADGLVIPARRAAGVGPAAEKAAAGGLAHLPVTRVTNLTRALEQLGQTGVWSVGLDADGETRLHDCRLLTEPAVIVVGAEGRGLSRLVAEACDQLVSVPMRGRVGSLNASVAAGVALYETWRVRNAA